MPRTARVVVPNHPHQVLHRGVKGFGVFARAEFCRAYLDHLKHCKQELDVRVYAYCLMPDHVRLILDPAAHPERMGELMKLLAGRHSQLVNGLTGRRGRVWEGRFRSTPVQSDRFLLACMRFVEACPVRAGMVERAEAYPWSSLRERRPGQDRPVLDFPAHYLACAERSDIRYHRYVEWLGTEVPDTENRFFGWSVRSGTPCGTQEFIRGIEAEYGVRFPRKLYANCHPQRSGILV